VRSWRNGDSDESIVDDSGEISIRILKAWETSSSSHVAGLVFLQFLRIEKESLVWQFCGRFFDNQGQFVPNAA
jgi:hypothetical protein